MFVFPGMIAGPASEVGIKVPDFKTKRLGADGLPTEDFEPSEFPHFHVLCTLTLGRALDMGGGWYDQLKNNAKLLLTLDDQQIRTVTVDDLRAMGVEF